MDLTPQAETLLQHMADEHPTIDLDDAATEREHVFEEFVCLDGSAGAESVGGGTGVGLAVVRALVDTNGRRVWCEETPGGGATFVLTVPSEPNGKASVEAPVEVS